jgi:uncharacterized protein YtpQ (UPF0354 family)
MQVMPIRTELRETLTPRERAELDWEREYAKLQVEYGTKVQELDLEVRKLEAKWSSLLKLPLAVVLLPVKLIMALAIPIAAITKHDLSDKFWEFMR